MDTQALVKDFVEWVLEQEGKSYCWPTEENHYSGKNLPGCLYHDCFDCSGLITNGLYHASGGKLDWRATVNAQHLFDRTDRLERGQAQPGDLAFYGLAANMISHVMMVAADGKAFGACGGTHLTVSPDIAKQTGARVRYRLSPDYRRDLRGFGRNPLLTTRY